MDKKILKYALQNSIKFNGKASSGAVIGKLIQEDPSVKSKLGEIKKEIDDIINDISKLSVEEQTKQLRKIAPELLMEDKTKKRKSLPRIKTVKNMVMRFAPSPSGPLHIGHAYPLLLNAEFCKQYKGKLIIRIEDTNPDNIYPPAYGLIPQDAEWATQQKVQVIIQSDRLEKYYAVAEDLLEKGNAYVCICEAESFRKLVNKKQSCPCRDIPVKENIQRWKKMFSDYKPGEAVLRIKTDIQHNNPAMRDWPAARINESEHPRAGKKYRVWPLMNLSVAVDDSDLKITHTVRGKDHMDNERRQKYIYDYLGWRMAEHLYIGRINFAGMEVSCSATRPKIESGEYTGWDDIRLPFLMALKRRGYQPESLRKYALDVGVTQNDKSVSKSEFFKTLNAFNKEIIDSKSYRYFFVQDPVKIKIEDAPEQKIELDLQPDNHEGGRKFIVKDDYYISKEDYESLRDNVLYRLMGCVNFVKDRGKISFDSLEYEKFKSAGKKIMHWLPVSSDLVKVEVLMDDGHTAKGLGENTLKNVKVGDVMQLERFGFCRLDKKDKNKLVFWFAHR